MFSYGFHCGVGGNHNGFGWHISELHAAKVPFFVKSVDSGGQCLEAANIARGDMSVAHTIIFRLSTAGQNDGKDYDVPNYNATPSQAASDHWQITLNRLPSEIRSNKDLVWIEPINEVDKNRADWIGHFMSELAAIANSQGYKVTGPSWSSGEPEWDHWKTAGMVRYLRYCEANRGRAAVAVHEYDYNLQGMSHSDVYPWHIGRFLRIFDVCNTYDIAYPEIHITEFGWGMTTIPPVDSCLAQLDWAYRNVYGSRGQWVRGGALWCLQKYQGDIHNQTQRLITPVTNYMLNLPSVPPTEPPSPPSTNVLVNGSFEQGWSDIPGGQQPNGWTVTFTTGPNPIDPLWPYIQPEFQVKPRNQLPPSEQNVFILDGDHCYKIFKGSGAWHVKLTQTLNVADGRYRLSLPIFGDFVTGYTPNGGKIFATYTEAHPAGQIRVGNSEWILMKPGEMIAYEAEMNVKRGDTLSVEIRGNYPLPQNGIFTDNWQMRLLSGEGGGYKSVVFKLAQEHTRAEWQAIAGLAYDEFKRTMTASHDNCIVMVGDGNSESYAVVFDPYLPSQQAAIAALQEAGLNYQTRPFRG